MSIKKIIQAAAENNPLEVQEAFAEEIQNRIVAALEEKYKKMAAKAEEADESDEDEDDEDDEDDEEEMDESGCSKKKVAEESTALDQANAAIKRDKAAEKARHDRMRDLARTQDARSRNQETK